MKPALDKQQMNLKQQLQNIAFEYIETASSFTYTHTHTHIYTN